MKQPLPFDEDQWLLENDLSTGFIELRAPPWLCEETTGEATINYRPHYGGRAHLDPGADAVGDCAAFTLPDSGNGYSINTTGVDMLVMGFQVEVESRRDRPIIEFGFHRDLGKDNTIMVDLRDETLTAGSETVNIPRGMLWEDAVPYTLVWDQLAGEAYCISGLKSPTIDTEAAGVSNETYYNVRMPRVEATDPALDNRVTVRSLSFRTYQYW